MRELKLVKKVIEPQKRLLVNEPMRFEKGVGIGATFSIGKNPIGDWADHSGELAIWDGQSWIFRAREPLDSFSLTKTALEENPANHKGILRAVKVGEILKKLDKALEDELKFILFENEQMDVIYESIDKCEWTATLLYFTEFFEEVEEAKKREVKVEKAKAEAQEKVE
jgi:hypothetical protein